jgi:beta-glucuronidase
MAARVFARHLNWDSMKYFKALLFCITAICLSACQGEQTTEPKSDIDTVAHETVSYIQNLGSRKILSLDGEWSRIIDPYENGYYNYRYQVHDNGYFKNQKKEKPRDLVEYNFETSPKLTVPGDWNTQERELYYYEGTIWYHKDFVLQKLAGQKYILEFGAVNYHAIVYVNGTKIGEHEGGFTAFQLDVTDAVVTGDNFVVVKVDNSRARDQVPTVNTDWWNYGGITRSVFIAEIPDAHIADYMLTLSEDIGPYQLKAIKYF